jgi:hypothetical protein
VVRKYCDGMVQDTVEQHLEEQGFDDVDTVMAALEAGPS